MGAPMSTTRARKVDDPARDSVWQHRAACLDVEPEVFWPVGTSGPAKAQAAAAKAVCFSCDVRAECLAFAFATRAEEGVWGGLDEEERRSLRRRRQRTGVA